MIEAAIMSGKGSTEVFEDAAVVFAQRTPALSTVRKARNPGCSLISTEMQLLTTLTRTYKATVNPDSPILGYVQVCLFEFEFLHVSHIMRIQLSVHDTHIMTHF